MYKPLNVQNQGDVDQLFVLFPGKLTSNVPCLKPKTNNNDFNRYICPAPEIIFHI